MAETGKTKQDIVPALLAELAEAQNQKMWFSAISVCVLLIKICTTAEFGKMPKANNCREWVRQYVLPVSRASGKVQDTRLLSNLKFGDSVQEFWIPRPDEDWVMQEICDCVRTAVVRYYERWAEKIQSLFPDSGSKEPGADPTPAPVPVFSEDKGKRNSGHRKRDAERKSRKNTRIRILCVCKAKGLTQKRTAESTGMSLSWVKRHWHDFDKTEKTK